MTAIQQQSSPNTISVQKPVAPSTSSFPNSLHPSATAPQPCQQQVQLPPALQTHAVTAQSNTEWMVQIVKKKIKNQNLALLAILSSFLYTR